MEDLFTALKLLGSLVLVLLLAYCSLRYLLPFLQRGGSLHVSNMEIIERLPLAPRTSLCLVKVGSRCFLLGLTPTRIEYLNEVNADEISKVETVSFAAIMQSKKEKIFRGGAVNEHNEQQ